MSSTTARLSQEVVRLVRASHALRAQIHAHHNDGIEWAAYTLLFHLCKDGPQRASALAASVCVDPSTVSRQVSQLVSRGLVERRADPEDGRATLLAATELGEERYRSVQDRRDRAFAHLLSGWSADDVDELTDLLRRLNDTLLDHRATLLEAMTAHSPLDEIPDASTDATLGVATDKDKTSA